MLDLNASLEPGMLVINPVKPSWGCGQIQSISQEKITLNFENVGKVVVDGNHVLLEEWTQNGG